MTRVLIVDDSALMRQLLTQILGSDPRIEVVAADTSDPSEVLRQQNPLGKIPTLVLEDGTTLFDSRVIVEYLDHLAGGKLLLPGEPRFAQQSRAANGPASPSQTCSGSLLVIPAATPSSRQPLCPRSITSTSCTSRSAAWQRASMLTRWRVSSRESSALVKAPRA